MYLKISKGLFILLGLVSLNAEAFQSSNQEVSFSKFKISSSSAEHFSLKIGDLDNDGNIDVVSNYGFQNAEDNYVVWYRNKGGGDFGVPKVIASGRPYFNEIKLYDIDKDGDLDLVTTANLQYENINELALFINNGNGVFSSKKLISNDLDYPYSLEIVDLNGDLLNDIIVLDINGLNVFHGDSEDNFLESKLIYSSVKDELGYVRTLDFDQDEDVDIFFSLSRSGTFLLENEGNGTFLEVERLFLNSESIEHYDISFGDINQDGFQDIIQTTGFGNGTINWSKNDEGTIESEHTIIADRNDISIAIETSYCDLDADGIKDIIALSWQENMLSWFPGTEDLMFEDQIIIPGIAQFSDDFDVVDLDSDGFLDIIVSQNDGLYWLRNELTNTSINEDKKQELTVGLKNNYPNPFNPTTQIVFDLPSIMHVQLNVYNIKGEKLATLIDAIKSEGEYIVTFRADRYPSGIYIYELITEQSRQIKKMTLIK